MSSQLRPKITKHKKQFKGFFTVNSGGSLAGTAVHEGDYGLQVLEGGRLNDKQLDNARTAIRRVLKADKGSKLILRAFPDRPVTSKGSEARMGKGKGAVDYFAKWLSPGAIVFEVKFCRMEIAKEAMRVAGAVLPLKTKMVAAENKTNRTPPRVLPFFLKKRFEMVEALEFEKARDAAFKI